MASGCLMGECKICKELIWEDEKYEFYNDNVFHSGCLKEKSYIRIVDVPKLDLYNIKNQIINLENQIKYCNEEEKISKGQVLITVTGNAIKHGILGDTSKYVSEEGINVKFNNAGYESNLK